MTCNWVLSNVKDRVAYYYIAADFNEIKIDNGIGKIQRYHLDDVHLYFVAANVNTL